MIAINDLAKMAIDISGKNISIRNIPGPEGVRGRNSDNTLIRDYLSWAPSQPLRVGMEKAYKWISAQVEIEAKNII
jgi:nucleoside-diphosphate-sugar epimerase